RALLFTFADKLQAVTAVKEEEKLARARELRDIYAALGGRLWVPIHTDIRQRVFELVYPELNAKIKADINACFNIDYDNLEKAVLPIVIKPLRKIILDVDIKAQTNFRKKTLFGFWEKTSSGRRPEYTNQDYSMIRDLNGLMVVTENVKPMVDRICEYLESKFIDHVVEYKVKGYYAIHISFRMRGYGSFQIMVLTQRDCAIYRWGSYESIGGVGLQGMPHWIYKFQGEWWAEEFRQVLKPDDLGMGEDFASNCARLYESLSDKVFVMVIQSPKKGNRLSVLELPKGASPFDIALHPQLDLDLSVCEGFSVARFNSTSNQFDAWEKLALDCPVKTGLMLLVENRVKSVSLSAFRKNSLPVSHLMILRSRLLSFLELKQQGLSEAAKIGQEQVKKAIKMEPEILSVLKDFME
ncbi:MAG: hypothetical protein WC357_05960, partial [Candidatus Omnitrophota bacterium]